ncbi:MAG: J domain-containing protein [Acidimicrobiia bacterium]|nr:J domain-containing protein [Acidimicrobiia bacterium]
MRKLLTGPSWYEILGVSAQATSAEIRRAYRELVAELEGDDSSDAEERLQEAKAAYDVLRDPSRRKEHDRLLAGNLSFLGTSAPDSDAAPTKDAPCRICGSEPTASAPLRRVTGAAILWVETRTHGPFCHDCGLAVYRAFQDHSLKAGWWGIAAVFYCAWALVSNARSRRAFDRLDAPDTETAHTADSPRPLDPAPPLLRRVGPWMGIGLGIVLVSALAFVFLWPRGGFSHDAVDYIPKEVAGRAVDPSSAFAKSVIEGLQDPAVKEVSSGTVGGGGAGAEALPDLILAAAETKDPEATKERLKRDLTQLENKVDTTTIDGVDVQIFDVSAGEGQPGISFAFASPDGAIVLWSIAFRDGRDNAVAGMEAMLAAGKK